MGLYTLSIETRDFYGQKQETLDLEVEFRTSYIDDELSCAGFQVFTSDNKDVTEMLTAKDIAYVNEKISDYIEKNLFEIVQDHESLMAAANYNDDLF